MNFWNKISARERRTIALMLGVSVAVLLWFFGYQPLLAARDGAARSAAELALEVGALRAQVDAVALAAPQSAAAAPLASVAAEVDRRAREARLDTTLVGIESLAENRVRVRFKAVSFDVLLDWLRTLEQQSGLKAIEFSAERISPGFVDAAVVLST